jgi:hypothetical protein
MDVDVDALEALEDMSDISTGNIELGVVALPDASLEVVVGVRSVMEKDVTADIELPLVDLLGMNRRTCPMSSRSQLPVGFAAARAVKGIPNLPATP